MQLQDVRQRTQEALQGIYSTFESLRFLGDDDGEYRDWDQNNKLPPWDREDPLPIPPRRRRGVSVTSVTSSASPHPRQQCVKPCLLLERLPFEIRRQIFAYVAGNDAVLVLPRRKKYGHLSLMQDHAMIHYTSAGRLLATTSTSFGFDHTKAIMIDFECPVSDRILYRSRLGSNEYSEDTMDKDALALALRNVKLWKGGRESIEDADDALHLFIGATRTFRLP
ncbi:MAG: hypothetical protein Q9162_005657 [Coniocarpon cinnabarinum]